MAIRIFLLGNAFMTTKYSMSISGFSGTAASTKNVKLQLLTKACHMMYVPEGTKISSSLNFVFVKGQRWRWVGGFRLLNSASKTLIGRQKTSKYVWRLH